MTAVDSNVFSSWIRYWEKTLKKPKEMALSAEYLPNLLPVAIESFERWDRSNRDEELSADSDHEAGLAVRLLGYALVKDTVVHLLKQELPEEVSSLKTVLAQETIDTRQVRETLETLQATLSEDLVKHSIKAQLALGEEADQRVLRGAAIVLAHQSLGRFPKSQLQRLLGRSLAEAATFVLLEENFDWISSRAEVESHMTTLYKQIIHEAAERSELHMTNASEETDLFKLFDDGWWRRSTYRLVSRLRQIYTEKLCEIEQTFSDATPTLDRIVSSFEEDQQMQHDTASEIVKHYVTNVFRRQIRPVVRQDRNLPSEMLGDAAEALERTLVDIGISNYPGLSGDDPERFPLRRTRSAEALATALPIALSEICTSSYVESHSALISQTASQLGERLIELLASEPDLSKRLVADENTHSLTTLCATWASRRSLHREMGHVLLQLNPSIGEYLQRLSHDVPHTDVSESGRFWALWRKYYAGEALSSYSPRIPWDVVEPHMLEGIVDRGLSRFFEAQSEYLVVFQVQNLNSEGLSWPMGHVTFYDPTHYDYGEGAYFPLPTEDKPAFSHAAVRVEADTPSAARRLARQRLFECLDCLSFGLSGNSLHPGFNPSVSDGEHIVNLPEGTGGFNYERTVDTHDEQRAETLELPAMARAYSSLLQKASDDPNSLTPLQEQFIRAVHWFREAHWEADFAKRFVLHYVGLEHIFARGERRKRQAIRRRAPKLNKTWRNIGPSLTFLSMSFRNTLNLIEKDAELQAIANGHDSFCGWAEDERVLLNPCKIRELLDLIPATRSDLHSRISRYLEELDSFSSDPTSIAAYVEHLRDYQLFKIDRLTQIRNDVVHEALYQDERMAFYAQEAQEILDDALDKMTGDVVPTDPECKTIDDLIVRYDAQPWTETTT